MNFQKKINVQGGIDRLSKKNLDIHKYQSEKGILKRGSSFHYHRHKHEKEKDVKEVKEIEEEQTSSFLEDSERDDTFIQINRVGDIDKEIDKSQLVEYDLFYKEQFFKNDVFKYDVNNTLKMKTKKRKIKK